MVQPGLATAAAPGKLLRQQSESRTVSVKPGDVLSVICERELGTVRRLDEVIALNPGLDPDRLFVGQKLRLPNTVTQPTLPRVVEASAPVPARELNRIRPESASFSTYTVRPGDVLSLIAKRELGSVRRMGEIVIANPGLDVDYLVVGQSLRMPGKRQQSSDVALARETRSPVLAQVKRASKPTRGRVR
jgi:LysM repeat protein